MVAATLICYCDARECVLEKVGNATNGCHYETADGAEVRFVATTPSLAGSPLYFTGNDNYTLVSSPYRVLAREFARPADAERAIAGWNRLGWKWAVQESAR